MEKWLCIEDSVPIERLLNKNCWYKFPDESKHLMKKLEFEKWPAVLQEEKPANESNLYICGRFYVAWSNDFFFEHLDKCFEQYLRRKYKDLIEKYFATRKTKVVKKLSEQCYEIEKESFHDWARRNNCWDSNFNHKLFWKLQNEK